MHTRRFLFEAGKLRSWTKKFGQTPKIRALSLHGAETVCSSQRCRHARTQRKRGSQAPSSAWQRTRLFHALSPPSPSWRTDSFVSCVLARVGWCLPAEATVLVGLPLSSRVIHDFRQHRPRMTVGCRPRCSHGNLIARAPDFVNLRGSNRGCPARTACIHAYVRDSLASPSVCTVPLAQSLYAS